MRRFLGSVFQSSRCCPSTRQFPLNSWMFSSTYVVIFNFILINFINFRREIRNDFLRSSARSEKKGQSLFTCKIASVFPLFFKLFMQSFISYLRKFKLTSCDRKRKVSLMSEKTNWGFFSGWKRPGSRETLLTSLLEGSCWISFKFNISTSLNAFFDLWMKKRKKIEQLTEFWVEVEDFEGISLRFGKSFHWDLKDLGKYLDFLKI